MKKTERYLAVAMAAVVCMSGISYAHPGPGRCGGHRDGLALAAGIVGLTGAAILTGAALANPPQTVVVNPAPVVVAPAPVVVQQPVYTAPVYSQPVYTQPVYTAPVYTAPVYTAPAYVAPAPVIVEPAPVVYDYSVGIGFGRGYYRGGYCRPAPCFGRGWCHPGPVAVPMGPGCGGRGPGGFGGGNRGPGGFGGGPGCGRR